MRTSRKERPRPRTRIAGLFVAAVLLTAAQAVSATTFMSVEPIPNRDVVGQDNLTLLRSIGYPNLERWICSLPPNASWSRASSRR